MTTRPIRLSVRIIALTFLALLAAKGQQGRKSIPPPNEYELERMIGNKLDTSVRVTSWKGAEPQRTNLFIYLVESPQLDEALMRRVADRFGMKGEIEQIRGETHGHFGYWIREPDPTNSKKRRELKFWVSTGRFVYSDGEDGFRWDIENHRPLMSGVPDRERAKQNALELLPLLGISLEDLECSAEGQVRSTFSTATTRYTDRVDKQSKTVPKSCNIAFFQRVPGGGSTVPVGDGGQVRFTFVSEGKVSMIERCFRKMQKTGEAKPKSSRQIIRELRNGNAWTWKQNVPAAVTVTNCVLAYPQGNSWLYQEYVWPFYMVTGVSSGGGAVTFFVPLDW